METKEQDPGSGRRGGLFESVKVLAATLLAIAHTRLEILSTEIEEQWLWLSSVLVWAVAALFCTFLGIVLGTLLIVFALWDTHRLLALGIPAGLFLLGGLVTWLVALGKARAKPRLFATTIAELSKDHKELTSGK
jgi:uncharacterized membrane protein YqjE